MARERVGLDLPDLSEFKPRDEAPPSVNPNEVRKAAEAAGFQGRHAPPPPATPPSVSSHGFDARSLRRTGRTAKLNIATREDTRERFWRLAQVMGLTVGEEVLINLMDAYERQNGL